MTGGAKGKGKKQQPEEMGDTRTVLYEIRQLRTELAGLSDLVESLRGELTKSRQKIKNMKKGQML